ncbi:MAG: hypothetical protein HC906_11730 [Bacteroidales bacterium]|nr:hypothetical protein [Bacteroidales bacterium]
MLKQFYEMKLAKLDLIRQYGSNYHSAAMDYNKNYAEQLYPKLRPAKKDTEEEVLVSA